MKKTITICALVLAMASYGLGCGAKEEAQNIKPSASIASPSQTSQSTPGSITKHSELDELINYEMPDYPSALLQQFDGQIPITIKYPFDSERRILKKDAAVLYSQFGKPLIEEKCQINYDDGRKEEGVTKTYSLHKQFPMPDFQLWGTKKKPLIVDINKKSEKYEKVLKMFKDKSVEYKETKSI